MLRRMSASLTLAAGLMAATAAFDRAAGAEVVISINKAAQSMSVLVNGVATYNWVVSTGIGGGPYDGTYRPGRLERHWASRKYNMAPMPYSIFFDGNYAIHGTTKVGLLGRRASKGCVRLHPRDAAILFELVQREKGSTTIVVDKATHIAARVTSVKSDAPAIEATAAKIESAKVEIPAAEQPEATPSGQPDVAAVAPVRQRKSGKAARQDYAKARAPLPFGLNYGSAQ
jgi:hypothetical protein